MKVNFMVHELYINFLSGENGKHNKIYSLWVLTIKTFNSVYFLVLGKKYWIWNVLMWIWKPFATMFFS